MKNITLKLITLAAMLACGGNAAAQDFDLSSLNVADIKASQASIKVPAPQVETDELIGMDMNIRVPFKMIKNSVVKMAAAEKRLSIINVNAPVIFKSGEFLRISNIKIDQGGIIIIPTLTLKPFLEGRDKLAIRIQKIQLHASMEPSMKAAAPAMTEEQVMVQVMDVLIKGVYSALDEKLKGKNLKGQDVVKLTYDKAAWTLRAALSPKALREFIPAGLMGDLHLTGFAFNETGLTLKIQTVE
jgi:hypothetical protein